MTELGFIEHCIAYVTLGLLCGWYQFLMVLFPLLVFFSIKGSYIAGTIIATGFVLTMVPLNHKPWTTFTRSWIFKLWIKYFNMEFESTVQLEKDKKYICFEFPHGIFPMGQFLSVYAVQDLFPGHTVCGTGADIIFKFPIMRHIMAWTGTVPASRKNIKKIFDQGHYAAVIPGGIAEMYVTNDETEKIYFKKRQNTIKVAIQEGANIIPLFFFGNSKLFHVVNGQGSDSMIARWSRRMRTSIMLFYGRHYLPVPFRHPLKMVTGDIVTVTQNDNPSDEDILEVQNRVIASIEKLYKEKKPDWETRPLVIA
eukprot:gene3197-6308_t